jgi:hypothetical protein
MHPPLSPYGLSAGYYVADGVQVQVAVAVKVHVADHDHVKVNVDHKPCDSV